MASTATSIRGCADACGSAPPNPCEGMQAATRDPAMGSRLVTSLRGWHVSCHDTTYNPLSSVTCQGSLLRLLVLTRPELGRLSECLRVRILRELATAGLYHWQYTLHEQYTAVIQDPTVFLAVAKSWTLELLCIAFYEYCRFDTSAFFFKKYKASKSSNVREGG